ncbi:MAG TPA: methionine--tRNA ligase [Candidatus Veblenbacteria bacterium]|nr:methionine--tRNA ligase [Candidatus Veblenbacteria bacterium]
MSRFYITTAIPYVNAKPHIGFALELVQADVIARYQRLKLGGENVYFLTGADENALKNVQAAEKEGRSTSEYVAEMSDRFRSLASALNISNNDFIRTTEQRHVKGATKLWQSCKPDDIYKKSYSGLYCVGCEQYYTEDELVDGVCPDHKVKPELVTEENYFFKLSSYQHKLEQLISNDEFKITPESRKNEMLAFIRRGLEDFSISRSRERARNWGVPVPGDDSQVMYVWFDALSNYLNALGYAANDSLYKEFWDNSGRKLHVIGKGITRFHCIYWPAMLLSAGLPLPNEVFVHGYVTVDGQKISKSLGNTVDPVELVNKYGSEPVRYYLLREIPAWEDGDFSEDKFKQRYESDLANGLGNTLSRVTNMVESFFDGDLGVSSIERNQINISKTTLGENVWGSLNLFKFDSALQEVMRYIKTIDIEIESVKPWELMKRNEVDRVKLRLSFWRDMLLTVGYLLQPCMPQTSEIIIRSLTAKRIVKAEPLFPRIT